MECPRNSFSDEPPTGGFKDCKSCPANTFTFQPAAPSKDRCRAKCPPGQNLLHEISKDTILLKTEKLRNHLLLLLSSGFYSSTGLAPCSACPQNFFQNIAGSMTCNECPTNMKTEKQGAVGREECKAVVCNENSCQHGGACVPMGHSTQWLVCYLTSIFTMFKEFLYAKKLIL